MRHCHGTEKNKIQEQQLEHEISVIHSFISVIHFWDTSPVREMLSNGQCIDWSASAICTRGVYMLGDGDEMVHENTNILARGSNNKFIPYSAKLPSQRLHSSRTCVKRSHTTEL